MRQNIDGIPVVEFDLDRVRSKKFIYRIPNDLQGTLDVGSKIFVTDNIEYGIEPFLCVLLELRDNDTFGLWEKQ